MAITAQLSHIKISREKCEIPIKTYGAGKPNTAAHILQEATTRTVVVSYWYGYDTSLAA